MEYYRLRVPIPKRPTRWIWANLATLLLLAVIVILLIAWRRDHAQLAGQLHLLKNPAPDYDAMQATGPPDSSQQGDSTAAWCPSTEDGGEEWLLLEFPNPVVPSAVVIHENFATGAVVRVTYLTPQGEEKTFWEGTYSPMTSIEGTMARVPVTSNQAVDRIKVYLDTAKSPGWNEIDAVGLVQVRDNGTVIWASRAAASSTWNQSGNFVPPAVIDSRPAAEPF